MTYASYAQHHPNELKIVGVADPIEPRRQMVADLYDLAPEQCYTSAEALAAAGPTGRLYYQRHDGPPTCAHGAAVASRRLRHALEKPFATSEAELWQLVDAVQRYESKVAICHVLRFAPFYAAIRQKLIDGVIGELLNIQAVEHVSYHHMAVGFVRGKWNNKKRCFSPMLMSKSCHDLDSDHVDEKRRSARACRQLWQQFSVSSRKSATRRRYTLSGRLSD